MMWKWSWLAASASLCLLALSASSNAQKAKKAGPSDEEIQRERMQKLIAAHDLAESGRKKNAPEFLITAAALLRELASIKGFQMMKKLDVQPEITGAGKPDLDKDVKAPSLLEQSDDLFQEASDMGAALGIKVDKLISLAKEREDKWIKQAKELEAIEKRAVVGGPKQVSKSIGPGQTHTYTYKLITGAFSQWFFVANRPLRVSVVHKENAYIWVDTTTPYAANVWHPNWHPNPKVRQAAIVIRVKNGSKQPARYKMLIQ